MLVSSRLSRALRASRGPAVGRSRPPALPAVVAGRASPAAAGARAPPASPRALSSSCAPTAPARRASAARAPLCAAAAPSRRASAAGAGAGPPPDAPPAPCAPVLSTEADATLLDMLTASAHWKNEGGFLSKTYEFKSPAKAAVFVARATDLWPKLCCPPQELVVAGAAVSLVVRDASGLIAGGGGEAQDTGFGRRPTHVELDIALAVDDVAADIQLAGGWN